MKLLFQIWAIIAVIIYIATKIAMQINLLTFIYMFFSRKELFNQNRLPLFLHLQIAHVHLQNE